MTLIRARKQTPHTGARAVSLWSAVSLVTAGAVTVVGALIAVGLWWFGIDTHVGASSGTVVSIIQLAFAFVAGVGGAVGLTIAFRKHLLEEHAEAREVAKHFNERFGAALDQLGSDQFAVKIGGTYAMAALADDWPPGRQQCIDVLCANIRRGYRPEPNTTRKDVGGSNVENQLEAQLTWKDDREFRHTLIRVIAEHLRDHSAGKSLIHWGDCRFDFTGAVFDGGDLSGIEIRGGTMNFERATFNSATVSFQHAKITNDGHLILNNANFNRCAVTFRDIQLAGGSLMFEGAEFNDGVVGFEHAMFTGHPTGFPEGTLTDGIVSFRNAKFNGSTVYFTETCFSGTIVCFSGAEFSGGTVRFDHAEFSGGAVEFEPGDSSAHAATFSGSIVTFDGAVFSGAAVDFRAVKLEGGMIDLTGARAVGTPNAQLPSFTADQLASGSVRLPEPH
jgi:uncharacterized protein YjbI with pentapeptide repeats